MCLIIPGRNLFNLISCNDIIINRKNPPVFVTAFEEAYLTIRKLENRIYSDEQVVQLPVIERTHVHFKEWKIRKRSANRLLSYLKKKNKPLVILEVGCGNGWLSGMMSSLNNSRVIGADLNKIELQQAKRVFDNRANLSFETGGLGNIDPDKKFDVIVFAASIQYFSSFDETIRSAFSHLNPHGEIHIIDSHFYQPKDLEKARQRSCAYFASMGNLAMNDFYFHHTMDSLNVFQYKILFNPSSVRNRITFTNDPFPWICITSR